MPNMARHPQHGDTATRIYDRTIFTTPQVISVPVLVAPLTVFQISRSYTSAATNFSLGPSLRHRRDPPRMPKDLTSFPTGLDVSMSRCTGRANADSACTRHGEADVLQRPTMEHCEALRRFRVPCASY